MPDYIRLERKYHSNGRLACEGRFIGMKKHGLSRAWYENGRLRMVERYENGERHGIEKWWWENGNPRCETFYENGKKTGVERWWDRNLTTVREIKRAGTKLEINSDYKKFDGVKYTLEADGENAVECFSLNGGAVLEETRYTCWKRDGMQTARFKNGKLAHLVKYFEDRIEGTERYYGEDGWPLSFTPWLNGVMHGVEYLFYSGMKVKEENIYKKDKRISSKQFNEEGQLLGENVDSAALVYGRRWNTQGTLIFEALKEGENSVERRWFPDGRPESETLFERNIRHGTEKKWHQSGAIREINQFEKGQWTESKVYNEEGALVIDYTAHQNLETVKKWFNNGRQKLIFQKKDRVKDGLCKEWHENGLRKSETVYFSGEIRMLSEWDAEGHIRREIRDDGSEKLEKRYVAGKIYDERLTVNRAVRRYLKYDGKGEVIVSRINGANIPVKYYRHPETITVKMLMEERDFTVRRALLQLMGYELFLGRVEHYVVDTEGEYSLISVNWRSDEETMMLLKVKCPTTGMYYVLRVPPYITEYREAVAWTFGLNGRDYSLEEEA